MSNLPNQKDYKDLTPFDLVLIQKFPFIEEDFDSINLYGILSIIKDKLNTAIANEQTIQENQTSLYNYVKDYFDNLDIKTEVDNKLDEMAENGELEEIIAKYLSQSSIKVRFLYRGDNKGDCSLIQTKDKNILIDLGNTTSSVLINKLQEIGVNKIDYVIISHYHGDHVMGYTENYDASNITNLLNSYVVDFSECIFVLPKTPDYNKFIYSDTSDGTNRDIAGATYIPLLEQNIVNAINAKGLQIIRPDDLSEIQLDDKSSLKFLNSNLSDFEDYYNISEYNGTVGKYITVYNNFSLVTELTHENHKFLFTGDIQKEAEEKIASHINYVDVLKVEHHGGNEIVNQEFYNKISPKIAVIMSTGSTGRNSDMINGLQLFGTEIYSSNVSKDIIVTSTTNYLFVVSTKGKHVFNANILKANKMNNFANVYSLSNDGIFIENGTDLNDLTTPGIYYCNNSADAQTLINSPVQAGFKLIVEYNQATNRIIQTIKVNNSAHSTSFVRTYLDTWGAWNKVIKEQTLFESSEGTNEDITLSKPYTVFDEIEIFYSVAGNNKSVKVPVRVSSNLRAILDFMYAGTQNIVMGSEIVTLNGTGLARGTIQAKNINISTNAITANTSLSILIHKVVGY